MSIQSIQEAAKQFEDAKEALKLEILTTNADGVPLTKCAKAAGVSRTTAIRWTEEAASK